LSRTKQGLAEEERIGREKKLGSEVELLGLGTRIENDVDIFIY
jgi:hypothetical protein